MRDDTLSNATSELAVSLQEWRTGVLNTLLVVVTVLATFAVASTVSQAVRDPSQWLAAGAFLLLYAVLLMLAVLRRINFRLRAGGLLLLGYLAGAMGLWRAGLAGDGRLYIFALPILAAILIGARSGLSMMGLDALPILMIGAFVAAMIVTSAYGYSIERVAYRPLRGSNRLIPLISAIGMSIFLQNVVLLAQDSKDKAIPNLMPGNLVFGESTMKAKPEAVAAIKGKATKKTTGDGEPSAEDGEGTE